MTAQMDTQPMLSEVVASNIAAEAARRRMTQRQLALGLGMSREAVAGRYTRRTPWSVDEVEKAADLFGMGVADLLVRQQGLEPRTRWLNGQPHLEAVAA